MKIKKTALLLVPFVILVFLASGLISTDTPKNWLLIDAGTFTVSVPPGWKLERMKALDSYAGKFIGDSAELYFDFGSWSGAYTDKKDAAYSTMHRFIDGHWAKIAAPKIPGKGYTAIYFGDVLKHSKFSFYGENLNLSQQETALRIFRTIRFKKEK